MTLSTSTRSSGDTPHPIFRRHAAHAGLSYGCIAAVIRNKNLLLRMAHACGWTSPHYEILRAWWPVRAALRGRSAGALGIVEFAERNNIPVDQFADCRIEQWKQHMFRRGRILFSVLATERNFRTVLRRAGLQPLFPQFRLASRRVSRYTLPLEQMDDRLRREILHAVAWKRAHRSKGRRARGRLRPRSVERLLETIQGLCAYATSTLGICDVTSMRQLLKEEIVCGFIDWLRSEPGRQTPGILTSMRYLHALISEYPLYKSGSYQWLRRKLKSLPREPKAALEQRKRKRVAAAYSLLREVPERIAADLAEATDPVRAAWLAHHRLLLAILLQKPFRNRNLRNLTLGDEASATICERTLPPRARRSLQLSYAERQALENNPERKFWVVHFDEDQTKGKKEVWWLVPNELIPLLTEYVTIYRPRLIGLAVDPCSLFINKARKDLSRRELAYLVAGLCMRYIRRPLTPHDFRRIFSTFFLAEGGKMEDLQKELDHNFIETTCGYCTGFDASFGVVVLEKLHRTRFSRAA